MSKKIKINNKGQIVLTDNDFLGAGGEAEVYVKDNDAYKIYHDPVKMISDKKMSELSSLSSMSNIIIPKDVIYDHKSTRIGFTMSRLGNVEPLCKIFTNSFKSRAGITESTLNDLVKGIQDTLNFIHKNEILVVDLNELNLLVPSSFDKVYFIDVDSYQTKSNPATAIMASIKDPLVKNNKWTEGSDWFSFAVIAFQMWIGIHPYKGGHPNYSKKDWLKRMEDGVSAFDPKSSLPQMCSPFSVIPPSHFQWMKAVFQDGLREEPPKMGDISILLSQKVNVFETSKDFEKTLIFTATVDIVTVFDVMGIKYIVGKDGIYKENIRLNFDISSSKVLFINGTGITPIVAKLEKDMITFNNIGGVKFSNVASTDMMSANGVIYSINNGFLYEHTFRNRDGKDLHSFRVAGNVMSNSVKMFDGILFQPMLKKQYAVIPYEVGKCSFTHIKELDDYRIIEAKYERGICVVLAENCGRYDRFIFYFENGCAKYSFRKEEDVVMSEVNFTVMPNGVTVMATDSDVDIFKGDMVRRIDNPPFNSSNKLFNISGTIHYVDGKKIYQASVKK